MIFQVTTSWELVIGVIGYLSTVVQEVSQSQLTPMLDSWAMLNTDKILSKIHLKLQIVLHISIWLSKSLFRAK